MHSPKFAAKVKTLSSSISASSLALAWKNKVRNDLKRQIVPDPLEYLDIHISYAAVCASVANEIQAGSYVPSHVTRITSEKSQGLCRLIVVPDPRDALVLQVLADSLWVELKKAAPSDKSFYAPKDHAFSNMKKGLEDEYGPIAQWIKFQKEILGFSKRYKFIIVTDIANYYDWIRYSGLRSVLSDLVAAKEVVLDILLFVLKAMIWRPDYMQNDDLGLPQCDFDAPRMLAHAFLFEIDGLLRDYPGVEFARYMDDIDIGVDSLAEAKRVLRDLDLTLQSRHIRLNSGKTKILTAAHALEHFCVSQNDTLDKIEKRFDRLHSSGVLTNQKRMLLKRLLKRWRAEGVFDRGNGSKILKRIVNYHRRYDIELEVEHFKFYFLNSPGMRETLLRYVSKSVDPIEYIEALDEVLASGQIVDDVSALRIANALVMARYTRKLPAGLIQRLISRLDKKLPFSLLSIIILCSRFLSYKDLRKLIDNGEYVWRVEPTVVRAVAGMLPYFRGHRDYSPVMRRLETIGGRSSNEVITFFNNVIWGDDFSKVRNFIKAPNKSYINGITHSKFGMIFGYLTNPNFSKAEKAKFLLAHTTMRQDYYCRRLVDARLRSLP